MWQTRELRLIAQITAKKVICADSEQATRLSIAESWRRHSGRRRLLLPAPWLGATPSRGTTPRFRGFSAANPRSCRWIRTFRTILKMAAVSTHKSRRRYYNNIAGNVKINPFNNTKVWRHLLRRACNESLKMGM